MMELGASGEASYGAPGRVARQIAVVRAIYDAFERRDIEGVLVHLAEDVRLELPATGRLVERDGPYVGHDGVRAYFADFGQVWQGLSLRADDIRAGAGSVIVFGHIEGRVDGVEVRRDVMWSWRVRDGLAIFVQAHDLRDTP